MHRLTIGILATLSLIGGGCAHDTPKLQPIPAPAAVVVKVPTYISLPADATMPCPKPEARPVTTDVDLLQAAMAFKVQAQCDENKLAAIRKAQPQ